MRRYVAVTLVVSLLVVVQSSLIDPTNYTETMNLCGDEFVDVYNYLVGQYNVLMIVLNMSYKHVAAWIYYSAEGKHLSGPDMHQNRHFDTPK